MLGIYGGFESISINLFVHVTIKDKWRDTVNCKQYKKKKKKWYTEQASFHKFYSTPPSHHLFGCNALLEYLGIKTFFFLPQSPP